MSDNKFIKDYYNNFLSSGEIADYEFHRWHETPAKEATYQMTKEAIVAALSKFSGINCLEVGPGNAVWTPLLRQAMPACQLTLVELSEKMLSAARQKLASHEQLEFVLGDIENYTTDKRFSVFFSIRSLEYWADKKKAFNNIFSLLASQANGLLVSKEPHPWRQWLRPTKVSDFHQRQISARQLKKLLKQVGFIDIKCRPAVIKLPFCQSAKVNYWLFKFFSRHSWPIFLLIAESYLITFKKP